MTANVGVRDARQPGKRTANHVADARCRARARGSHRLRRWRFHHRGAGRRSIPLPQTGGTLTVWVDSDRLAAAQLYQREHPSVKMKIVTYDGDANGSNYLQTKVSLFNRTRSGWPDVVFSSQNNEASWAVPAGFTAPLNKGMIPQATLAGWAKGANDPCLVDGTLYCLRNDLAQTVLWYNASLMKQWGYTVPTTWPRVRGTRQAGRRPASRLPGGNRR